MQSGKTQRDPPEPQQLSIQSQTNVSSQSNKVKKLIMQNIKNNFQPFPSPNNPAKLISKSPRNPQLRTHSSTDNNVVRPPKLINEYHIGIRNLTRKEEITPFYRAHAEPIFFSKIEERTGMSQVDLGKPGEKVNIDRWRNKLLLKRQMKAEGRQTDKREGRFDRGMSERLESVKKLRSLSRPDREYLQNLRNVLGQSQFGQEGPRSNLSKVDFGFKLERRVCISQNISPRT